MSLEHLCSSLAAGEFRQFVGGPVGAHHLYLGELVAVIRRLCGL
jgi:hypothetical protein